MIAPGPETIEEIFNSASSEDRVVFMPYLTAGYPSADASIELGQLYAECGANLIEVGIPFSDPLGDGPTIQRSSAKALVEGMTVKGALQVIGKITGTTACPVVAMGYYNPLAAYGLDAFCHDAQEAGVLGLIVPDLPLEESQPLHDACRAHDINLVFLLSPSSTEGRILAVAEQASGFIYCMSVTGVTGARTNLGDGLAPFLNQVHGATSVPIMVGFGISTPEHIRQLKGQADGVIVASALIDLFDTTTPGDRDKNLRVYIKELQNACSAS